jgi:hypothetical protein
VESRFISPASRCDISTGAVVSVPGRGIAGCPSHDLVDWPGGIGER